jgi:ABC-type transport system substrate-binding protein
LPYSRSQCAASARRRPLRKRPPPPRFTQTVEVDGRGIGLTCEGSGSPTVESTWWASADPSTWFAIWRCGAEFNQGYCNPELEALLDRADAELDPETRIALYEEAGHLLVADVPAIFVHTASNSVLVKSYVTGYSRITPDGNWPAMTNLLTIDVDRPAAT